jgi:EAL domain-containing protein (putative c-di-GMP-specific phosphodiesterase class I)
MKLLRSSHGSLSKSALARLDFDVEFANDQTPPVDPLPAGGARPVATEPRRDEIGEVLHAAVRERRLTAHFQPIATAADGRAEAVEALSRLRLPDGRLLSADRYVEVAEKLGLAPLLDWTTMEHALRAAREMGFPGTLFVNLAVETLLRGDFVARVKRTVGEFEIPPSRIVFEITERERIGDIARAQQVVRDLRGDGFGFALDDFGTGFASHQYLQLLRVDVVKIAGNFVADMVDNPRDAVLVEGITNLARRLGIKTIAESVASAAVLERVRRLGIDYVQGFFVGRPAAGLPRASAGVGPGTPAGERVSVTENGERAVDTMLEWAPDNTASGEAVQGNGKQEPLALTLKQAMDSHVAWREWMRGVVYGTKALNAPIENVAADDRCPLGRWIHSAAGARHLHLAEYCDLRTLHADFHRLAGNIVLEYESGNGELARQLFEGALRELSRKLQLQIVRLYERAGL